jgi:hypothetical protein
MNRAISSARICRRATYHQGRIMLGHPVIEISIHVEASPPRTALLPLISRSYK